MDEIKPVMGGEIWLYARVCPRYPCIVGADSGLCLPMFEREHAELSAAQAEIEQLKAENERLKQKLSELSIDQIEKRVLAKAFRESTSKLAVRAFWRYMNKTVRKHQYSDQFVDWGIIRCAINELLGDEEHVLPPQD